MGVLFVLLTWLLAGPFGRAPAQAQSGITSPAAGSAVSGDAPIFGTATIEPFQKYELHYKQEPSGDDAYIYFGGGTNQVVNGQLGVWQAGGLPPGVYSIRLRVVKTDGNYAEFFAPNLSVNQGPAPTPTSNAPTETPIPTATFTPAPQPTAVIGAVEQPTIEGGQQVLPTPTPGEVAAVDVGAGNASAAGSDTASSGLPAADSVGSNGATDSSLTRELGQALAFDKLRAHFWNGVRYSAVLCFGVLALFGGKRLFDWAWHQFR